ncbi:cytochrome P450 [Mycena latifolia]|nr:cytochrome P450 [Mycena latifolia]
MDYRSSLALLALVILLLKLFGKKILTSGLPFPPGPTLDSSSAIYQSPEYFFFMLKGGLVHARVFSDHIILVNDRKTAYDLFEKRSHVYSDRPYVPMIDLLGWDFNFGFMPYGTKWRRYRRTMQQHFRQDVSRVYQPIQKKKIHDFLRGLLSRPENFVALYKTLAAAIIMDTVYGYQVEPTDDYFVTLSENALKKLTHSTLPGAAAVNTIPILRYFPGWFPGCGFQRIAAESRQLTQEMRQLPFEFVKQNMRDGIDSKSITAKLLETNQARGRTDEPMIQEVAALAYAAGADTTVSAIGSFFLSMAIHPEIQQKAQNELDTVIGSRLPEFEDRPSLPYIEALYREVMRWRPVLPLGVAHATTEDDVYEGYFIPKAANLVVTVYLGATVMSNIWAMTHDESIYPEPDRFNPDRFLRADGTLNDDDTVLAFGSGHLVHPPLVFGRRVCVGKHAADATVWATIASVLATFTIGKATDRAGNVIEIEPVYSDGFISHPEPFRCSIKPRSEAAKSLVQATVEDMPL